MKKILFMILALSTIAIKAEEWKKIGGPYENDNECIKPSSMSAYGYTQYECRRNTQGKLELWKGPFISIK